MMMRAKVAGFDGLEGYSPGSVINVDYEQARRLLFLDHADVLDGQEPMSLAAALRRLKVTKEMIGDAAIGVPRKQELLAALEAE